MVKKKKNRQKQNGHRRPWRNRTKPEESGIRTVGEWSVGDVCHVWISIVNSGSGSGVNPKAPFPALLHLVYFPLIGRKNRSHFTCDAGGNWILSRPSLEQLTRLWLNRAICWLGAQNRKLSHLKVLEQWNGILQISASVSMLGLRQETEALGE